MPTLIRLLIREAVDLSVFSLEEREKALPYGGKRDSAGPDLFRQLADKVRREH